MIAERAYEPDYGLRGYTCSDMSERYRPESLNDYKIQEGDAEPLGRQIDPEVLATTANSRYSVDIKAHISEALSKVRELRAPSSVSVTDKPETYLNYVETEGCEPIKGYMASNSDLVCFIESTLSEMAMKFPEHSVGLSLYVDNVECWEKLFIVMTTSIDDVEKLVDLEDDLVNKYLAPNSELLFGRVALSLR